MKLLTEYQYFGNIIYNKMLYNSTYSYFNIFEKYKKSSYRNQMELPGPNGLLNLSIPLEGGRDQNNPTSEIKIDYTQQWQAKHFKAIYATYKNSPWFDYYEPSLASLYKQQPTLLYQWNKLCVAWVMKALKKNAIMTDVVSHAGKAMLSNLEDHTNLSSKKNELLTQLILPKYYQVFEDRIGFLSNMCILDLIFCEGPNAPTYLEKIDLGNLFKQ